MNPSIQEFVPSVRPARSAKITTTINGVKHTFDVDARLTLAELIREKLRLTGTKVGCNRAECGVCTVLMDDLPVFSCSVLAVEVDQRRIETIEGIVAGTGAEDALHPIQRAFIENDALQCGYCTPGMIMSVMAILNSGKKKLWEASIKSAIAGNYCRCGAYPNIVKATLAAYQEMQLGRNGKRER